VENRPNRPYCPPVSKANPTSEADTADGADSIWWDKENAKDKERMAPNQKEIIHLLGMSIEQALGIWTGKGKPVVHFGSGENCFDLERLLSSPNVKPEYLSAVKSWLAQERNDYLSQHAAKHEYGKEL